MPIAKKKEISPDFLEQMKENLKKDSEDETTVDQNKNTEIKSEEVSNQKQSEPVNAPHKKENDKYSDVVNIRLSKGKRNEMKIFCTSCGMTMTQYIETAFDFLSREAAAGNIIVSKGGITKVSK